MANLNLTDIFKYGYGLLKLGKDELYCMDSVDFLERVEGHLLWHEHSLDEQLNNHAWYTANLMMASGNMPKKTDALKLKKSLYKSLEDIQEDKDKQLNKAKNVEAEKQKLMQRFNLGQQN